MKLAIALLLATASCTGPRMANECPGSSNVGCITRPVCVEDKARGCMRCTCDSPEGTETPPPAGTHPD